MSTVLEIFVVKLFAVFGIALSGANLDVAMGEPVVELRTDSIAVSAGLLKPVSDDLLNIIDSGTPVSLVFACRLRYADGRPGGVPDRTVAHTVSHDLETGAYRIGTSARTIRASVLSETSVFFRLETVPLWPASAIEAGEYVVEVSARLEPISIHATGRQFDLMALWNYSEPTNRSPIFTQTALGRRRVSP